MIHAAIQDGRILIRSDDIDGTTAARLPGARRTKRMPPLTWTMPLTLDSIDALRRTGALGTRELHAEAARLKSVGDYIMRLKNTDGPVAPIVSVPINSGYTLFNHQVKAYNIALALMGYEFEEEHQDDKREH